MSWLKVDDKFPRHPKVLDLSDAAFRLHVAAKCYCAEHETDGRIKPSAVETLTKHRNKAPLAQELVDAGLWELIVGGWEIHDYLKYNPSHAELEAKRESARVRMDKARSQLVRANIPRTEREHVANETETGSLNPVPARPVPSDPIGSVGARAPRKRRSALPEGWQPDEKDHAFARKHGWITQKIAEEADKFAAHHGGHGSLMLDWNRAWQTWVLRAKDFAPRSPPPRSGNFQSAPQVATMTYREFRSDPPPPLADPQKQAALAAGIARIGKGGT